MLIKILGIIDLLSAITIQLVIYHLITFRLALVIAMLICLKGFIYRHNLVSSLDMIIGVFILLSFLIPLKIFGALITLYLLQKSFLSLF